jgi:Tfp pilus assembly protein PilO
MLKALILPLSFILAVIIFVSLSLPSFNEARSKQTDIIDQKQQEYDQEVAINNNIDQLKTAYEGKEEEKDLILQALPKNNEVKSLIVQYYDILDNNQMYYESIAFGIEEKSDQTESKIAKLPQVKPIEIEIQVSGTYNDVKNFIQSIENSVRLANIKDLNLSFESKQGSEETGLFIDVMTAELLIEVYQKDEIDNLIVKQAFGSSGSAQTNTTN